MSSSPQRVVIGIDPHKRSWTASAVDTEDREVDTITTAATSAGYRQIRQFAQRWDVVVWAIEGATGLGEPLARRLIDDGIDPVDVPAKLSARTRQLSEGHGRKTDDLDAKAVAIAARTSRGCRTVRFDDNSESLRMLSDHHDELTTRRTQTINRLHVLLTGLIDGGAPKNLTADQAAQLCRRVRNPQGIKATRRDLAREHIAEIRRLDRQLATNRERIHSLTQRELPHTLQLQGMGPVLAARVAGRTRDITRFPTRGHFASFCGTAPIEVASGNTSRHRLSRAGDRKLNHALHIMALVQIRHDGPGARGRSGHATRDFAGPGAVRPHAAQAAIDTRATA